jgi:hypothetical protein
LSLEIVSLKGAPREFKVALLENLGYDVDKQGYVVDSKGERIKDKYAGKEVNIDNMAVFPTRSPVVVMDDNLLSITSYIEEYEEAS